MSLAGLQLAYILCRNWQVLLLRGLLAVAFGVLVLVLTRDHLKILVNPFSAYALIDGILGVGIAIGEIPGRPYWWVLIFRGLASVGAGILMYFVPPNVLNVFLGYLAIWMTVTGVLDIMTAYYLRRKLGSRWLLFLSGIASVVFAILLVVLRNTGAIVISRLVAADVVIGGVLLGILAFRARDATLPSA